MPDLVPIREQVYSDPRPKDYCDRFHERSRTHEPDGVAPDSVRAGDEARHKRRVGG